MRMMKGDWMENPVKVYGWAMLRNGWEYYFLDDRRGDIRLALVCGFENEMGDVSMSEIQPHLAAITFSPSALRDIAPAIGCVWVDA